MVFLTEPYCETNFQSKISGRQHAHAMLLSFFGASIYGGHKIGQKNKTDSSILPSVSFAFSGVDKAF